MSYDGSIRKFPFKEFNERQKCHFLFRCPGVLRRAVVGGEPSDVADADRVGIVTATTGSSDVFWTGGLDGAVDGDDVVVAAACPTEGSVVTSGN